MVEKASSSKKVSKLFSLAKGVDVIFLANGSVRDPNFTYLTEFESGIFEDTVMVVSKPDKLHIFTSMLEYDTALNEKQSNMDIMRIDTREELMKGLEKLVAKKKVGINSDLLSVRFYEFVKKHKASKLIDVSEQLLEARLVKSKEEVENIKHASDITKLAIKRLQKELRAGMTELQAAAKFNYLVYKYGATGLAFDTIVAFGKNTAYPHHMPDNTKLKEGDLVLVDAGAEYKNYCGDVTRTTIFKSGKAKDFKGVIEMMQVVADAQQQAIKQISAKKTGAEIHEIASNIIDTANKGRYKGTFIHSLGHSVGIEVHDGKGFSPSNKEQLKAGMVVSVEPGIYIPGFGGARIEDDVLITEKGCEIL